MKKISGIVFKIILGLILLIIVLIVTVPLLFKEKIKVKIEQSVNESVNARVAFGDYTLSLLKNFPNLAFTISNVSVTGTDKFSEDTLADINSIGIVFDLSSLWKKTGYEIKSILIKQAEINTIILKDGRANWDIMATPAETYTITSSQSTMKIKLQKVEFLNSSVSYTDYESDISARLDNLSGSLKGDLTGSETNLSVSLSAKKFTYEMEGIKYFNNAVVDSKINLLANLDSMKFMLRDNYLKINDLDMIFDGMVAMPGDDIETDLSFKSGQTPFKSLMSMIPAIYLNDFKDLKADGEFILSGSAKGIYSDSDSTMPDLNINLSISGGSISYPSLPEKVTNINLESDIFIDGKTMDRSKVDIKRFHMELAGNPFDMSFRVTTPVSDPDLNGTVKGKIDLKALSEAIPFDSLKLSGLISISVSIEGRLSALEKEKYDEFSASGSMDINQMQVSYTGYPEVRINEAGFAFTPAYAELKKADVKLGGKSDFKLAGRLENYIPYLLKDQTVRGRMTMNSDMVDLSDIMKGITADTTTVDDTASLAVVRVPENIDFNFDAFINQFVYNKIKVQNVRGNIIVKNGILSLKEADMELLGGKISMNADYNTRDTLKPSMRADLRIENLGIKDAFNTFNTVQLLAPTARGLNGKVSASIAYSSLLRKDFMPVITTISGGGKLNSTEVTLVESKVFNNMKTLLKLNNKYSNTFKDINASFKISNGRIYVSPFNTKVGNLKMNISGDQGIDQTLNYVIRTEMPRSDLGGEVNNLIDNLATQAAAFGLAFKPSEIIKVNVKVTGTFFKPLVTPFFGNEPPDSAALLRSQSKGIVKDAVDYEMSKAKEKARSEAEAKADKLIMEAEQKGKELREEASIAAGQIRNEAEVQYQKLIKEAEAKGAIAKMAAQKAADALKKEAFRKADQLEKEADNQANKLIDEAKRQKEELLNKI